MYGMHTKLSSANDNYPDHCVVPEDLEVWVGMLNKWDQKQKAAEMY